MAKVTIERLYASSSKQDEITFLKKVKAAAGEDTYIASFLSDELIAWLERRITDDWSTDIFEEYTNLETNGEKNATAAVLQHVRHVRELIEAEKMNEELRIRKRLRESGRAPLIIAGEEPVPGRRPTPHAFLDDIVQDTSAVRPSELAIAMAAQRLARGCQLKRPYYADVNDEIRDKEDAVAKQDALDIQHEAEAEQWCFEQAQQAVANHEAIACPDCHGCERGEALVREMEEERVKEIERSAAAECADNGDDNVTEN
jgi:hypothetical protein